MEKIVGGGQKPSGRLMAAAKRSSGRTAEELVTIRADEKSHFVRGIVTEIIEKSPERSTPRDE